MPDIFHISKLIIKKKLKVLTDADELHLKTFNKQYPFTKAIKIEALVDNIESYSSINKAQAWESIVMKSQKRKDQPAFTLFKKPWYKYAAAAAFIALLATSYFLKEGLLHLDTKTTPVIVNTNTIQPGTDKATLILGDGSQVALEKGEELQTQYAESNGEAIIYKASQNKAKNTPYNYLSIPRGGQFLIKLSDGTQVWLNSESQLKYPVSFEAGKTRQVELVYGEAYFDVSPSSEHQGAKFTVLNKSQEVEVLGTEFNIKAYKDEAIVYTTLVEGKVAVTYENKKQNLVPNQQLSFNAQTKNASIKAVDVYNEISWKEGFFSFERKPLKDIMKVLSRWYDIDVIFENKSLEEVKFFGVLGKDQNIEDILETIKNFKIIEEYEITGKTILLK